MMRHKTDIFFDLDHTLWDFEANSDRAYRQLFKEKSVSFSPEEFFRIYHPVNEKLWEQYSRKEISKEEVKYRRLKETLTQLNIHLSDAEIMQWAERYLELLPGGTALFPGTKEILSFLKGKYRLHLLTNGFLEVQHKKIKNAGLDIYFETVTVSEETGELKPHPAVFAHALKKAGTVAHLSVMVGDNLRADILGAKNIGMDAILFDPHQKSGLPETVAPTIHRLDELLNIFGKEIVN